eukprot:scaffold240359_cov46-Attheya_sp.AAC.2
MSVILATGGYDHNIRFWEAPSGICSRTLRYPDSPVNCLEITPDKQFLAAGGNPHIRLFEINTALSNPVLTLEGHTAPVTSLGFQRDGRYLYSCSEDGAYCVRYCQTVGSSESRAEIISGDQNGCVKVWDLGSSRCINDLVPDSNAGGSRARVPIQAVDISEDCRTLVATSNHAQVYVWDASNSRDFKPITKFRAHNPGFYCLHAKISPDCRHLVTTSSDKTVRLWDTTTWELTQTLAQHQKWVWDAVFSADSSYLVTASSDHSARLWNLRTGDVVREYKGHQTAVTCVALNDSSK